MNPQIDNNQTQNTENQEPLQRQPPVQTIYPDPDKIKQDKSFSQQSMGGFVEPAVNTRSKSEAPIDGLLALWMAWCTFIAVGAFFFLFSLEEGQMFGGKGLHDILLLPAIGITAGLAAFNIWRRNVSGKRLSLYFIALSAAYLLFESIVDTSYGGLDFNDIFFISLICGGQAAYISFSKQVAKTLTN